MNTPNTDDKLAGELLASLHQAGSLQQELAHSNTLVSELMEAMRDLLSVADHEKLTVGGQERIDMAEALLTRIEKSDRQVLSEAVFRPHLIPFGGGVLLTGSMISPEASVFLIRGCRDGYDEASGKTPQEAWDASRGAPEWWLVFTDPVEAIKLSDQLNLIAHDMRAARIAADEDDPK
jgi:hypothetical protein